MDSKYSRITLISVSLVLLIVMLLYIPASKIQSIEYSSKSGREYIYFTGGKLGLRFLAKELEDSILPPKVLEFIKDDEPELKLMRSSRGDYVLAVGPQSVKAYNDDNQVYSYDVKSSNQEIMDSFLSDFDNDGDDELFLLLKNGGQDFGEKISALYWNEGFYLLYEENISYLNPWKVEVCDVDGDGEKEISLGVYTKSIFHQEYAKRPFIYNLINGRLYPKWLGSRLSRPFEDYVFSDMDGDGMEELIVLEILREGKKVLNSYRWKGFGFESVGNSREFQDISHLNKSGTGVSAMVLEDGIWKNRSFKHFEDRLVDEDNVNKNTRR